MNTIPTLKSSECVPSELRDLNQWVGWRYEERNGEETKVPYGPRTGKKASVADPGTWASFEEACDAAAGNGWDGIGFVFTAEDPYVGIDLDKVRDPDTGGIKPAAVTIIKHLNSYTEISPSGKGVHIIVKGKLPPGRNRRKGIEMYETGRYFTMTGHRLESIS